MSSIKGLYQFSYQIFVFVTNLISTSTYSVHKTMNENITESFLKEALIELAYLKNITSQQQQKINSLEKLFIKYFNSATQNQPSHTPDEETISITETFTQAKSIDESSSSVLHTVSSLTLTHPIIFSRVLMLSGQGRSKIENFQLIIVTIDANEMLYLHDIHGVLITSLSIINDDNKTATIITAMSTDSTDANYPIIVVALSDGTINIINLKRMKLTLTTFGVQVSISTTFKLTSTNNIGESNQIYATSITTISKSKTGCFVFIGTNTGQLFRYLCNGRLTTSYTHNFSENDTNNTLKQPVTNIIVSKSSIAITIVNQIIILDIQKFKVLDIQCSLPGTITQLQMDERLGWLLIAVLENGDIYTINTIMPSKRKILSPDQRKCLITKLSSSSSSSNTTNDVHHNSYGNTDDNFTTVYPLRTGLGSYKGYFMTTLNCTLSVYNNTPTTRQELNAYIQELIDYHPYSCYDYNTAVYSTNMRSNHTSTSDSSEVNRNNDIYDNTVNPSLYRMNGLSIQVHTQGYGQKRNHGIFGLLSNVMNIFFPTVVKDISKRYIIVSYNTHENTVNSTSNNPSEITQQNNTCGNTIVNQNQSKANFLQNIFKQKKSQKVSNACVPDTDLNKSSSSSLSMSTPLSTSFPYTHSIIKVYTMDISNKIHVETTNTQKKPINLGSIFEGENFKIYFIFIFGIMLLFWRRKKDNAPKPVRMLNKKRN